MIINLPLIQPLSRMYIYEAFFGIKKVSVIIDA